MKKIILLAAFAFLTACSSEEWSPVLVEDETVESSYDVAELSSSSVEPVIESSSETVAKSSFSVVTVSSSSIETAKSSSSTNCDEECQRILNMTTEEFCHEIYNEFNCDVAIAHGCREYLFDECVAAK